MDLTMVAAARPHGELIAHFPPECAVPREPQIVGIRVATGRLLFVEPVLPSF
jgi:hypothetical protein